MKTLKLILVICCILVLGITSCQGSPSQVEPIPEDQLKTLVAGTLTAVAIDVAQSQTAAVPPTETSTPTETLAPATETSGPPTVTPTREMVTLTMTGATNCRRGTSTYFPVIKTFEAGDVVEVIGINSAGDYYYVKAAESETGGCWVWNQFATLSGNANALAVYTPVPTPLPTATNTPPPVPVYTVTYAGLTACGTGWAANFSITNTGSLTLQSIRILNYLEGVTDPFVHESNDFTQWSGGVKYAVVSEIGKGVTMIVSTCQPGKFDTDPTNKTVQSKITICSRDDLEGACTVTNLEFIPH
jgi:hypothetical protein